MSKKNITASKKKQVPVKRTFLDETDAFFDKYEKIIFWSIFAVTALVSIGLYDPRVSLTGDDSSYIIRANEFIKNFSFPVFQGPLYPIVLSPIILIFGISLLPIKLFSMVSMLACMFFTYRAFRKRVPASILFFSLFLVSINSFVLYYSSQAYSEAFYMFLQTLVIFVFFRHFIDNNENEKSIVSSLKGHLLLALTILAASLTRSVGFSLIIAACGYFLFYKQWKNIALSLGCFIALYAIYSVIKGAVWGHNGLSFSAQGSGLMLKDFYHPELGNEDFVGLLVRFWQNSVQYLSNGLLRIIGFNIESGKNSVLMALTVYALAIGGLFLSYKKNKYLFFTILLTGAFLVVTFFSLQVAWNQERLIIPVYMFILVSIFTCLYYLLTLTANVVQGVYLLPVVVLFVLGVRTTVSAVEKASEITDEYSQLTPDWVNYMKASEWVSKNLAEDDLVASRKPTISTIYGHGKTFHGITKVPTESSTDFLDEWGKNQDKYVGIDQNGYNLFSRYRKDYKARLQIGDNAYLIVNTSEPLIQDMVHNGIRPYSFEDIKGVSERVNHNFAVFCADSLLNNLYNAKVTHIMTANLRSYPEMKTEYTINTVERYAFYIQEKYPEIFEFVYQEGKTTDEPAQIYRIRWEIFEEKK